MVRLVFYNTGYTALQHYVLQVRVLLRKAGKNVTNYNILSQTIVSSATTFTISNLL
jgi:hypothetical protein